MSVFKPQMFRDEFPTEVHGAAGEMTDSERLDIIEANPNTFEAYKNGSSSTDNGLYWHYKRPDGFLSNDHANTLRATIDSFVAMRKRAEGGVQ